MPSPDDKLTDMPSIVPERDEVSSYRRQRGEPAETRKSARAAASAQQSDGSAGGVSAGWRVLAITGLLVALATAGAAAWLQQQTVMLQAALEQSNLRISDLEGRLSSTDDSVTQSSASMQVRIKELGAEVDKLWASAWRKNNGRLDEMDATLKKLGASADSDRKQITTLVANTAALQKQVATSGDLASSLETLKQQQANVQTAIGRLNSTVNTLASTQSAQEARLKENEQWVQSNIEFRKQVTQRLTRLENPPSALP
jgi:chromosome segregation ATPase